MKRLTWIVLTAVLASSCMDQGTRSGRGGQKAEPAGPNQTARSLVEAMAIKDLSGMKARSTGHAAEYLEVLIELDASRDRFCEFWLERLPEGPERARVEALVLSPFPVLHGPWNGAELKGFIEEEGDLRRYLIHARDLKGKGADRVLVLERQEDDWYLNAIDDWPALELLIQLRNRVNKIGYVIENRLKKLESEDQKALDLESLQIIEAFESLKGQP